MTEFDQSSADDPFRLQRTVVPHRYDLRLEPSLDDASFQGRVTIEVEVVEPTAHIVLNADELEIRSVAVDGHDAAFRSVPDTERLVITPESAVGPGRAVVTIDFSGVLNDKLRGFYRSTFTDSEGQQRFVATTQMQPTDCRRAFPCWDEPDFKAVFGVTMVVEPGLMAISNGPEISSTVLDDGRTEVRFGDTMVMSTYLVAFIVGPLEATEPVLVDGVPVRVVHLPGKAHLTAWSLDLGVRALRWFHEYYGIPYADQKIDLVAIPDFAAGAMENTGCITFRENLLLIDPTTATLAEQMLVADVICHELAHMWFGNLVTMRWWNGIWLNEAFATFMEIASVDALRPAWRRWDVFGQERSAAFDTDSLGSTRPIEYEVRSPEDCEGMFDVLTYQKGGAILRMLEQFLGADLFRDGVRHYLTTHSFSNTETGDLWDAIEHVVSERGGTEPVRQLMDSWIWQPGYPLVSASVDGHDIVLNQQRFGFGAGSAVPEADTVTTTWLVPVHVRVGTDQEVKVLLTDEPVRIRVSDPSAPIVVNAGGHGFYRVAYSTALLDRLRGGALADLAAVERYNLVDDAWNATVAGRLTAADLLALLRGFGDETDLSVWQAITAALGGLARLVRGDALDALRAEVRTLVAPALGLVGWDPAPHEPESTARLRGLLVTAVAVLGAEPDAQVRCRALLDAADADPSSVDPELVAAATSAVASTGDQAVYDRLVHAFRTAGTPQQQIRNLYSLAELPTADLIAQTCAFAFSGEVRTQNAPFLLNLCIGHREHGDVAWTAVRNAWETANETFPSSTIVRMIGGVRHLNTPELAADVQGFFAEHDIPQAAKTLQQILERQRVNVALRLREEAPLSHALLGSRSAS